MRSFLIHLHPPKVARRTLRPLTTLGLGVLALVLFSVLGLTGVLLMLYYIPTVGGALPSTQDIEYAVTFGSTIRALHRYAAHAMVLVVFCHLLRVFFTAAYRGRTLNWLIGLSLFGCTLVLAFTGYLLPGDQLSYWAVVVSTNLLDHLPLLGLPLKRLLLGGGDIGDPAMIRFYTLHVALAPSLMGCLVIWHLWRVRKDGGLAGNTPGTTPELAPAHPHLTLREGILALLASAALLIIAMAVAAPLGGPPDIHQPSNPEKTPWYFLFLQEMVSYSATVGGFVFPALLVGALALLPFAERGESQLGAWFGSSRERRLCLASAAAGVALFVALQWIYMHPVAAEQLLLAPIWLRRLLNPAAVMMAAAFIAGIAGGRLGASRGAALCAGAVLLVGIIGFTFMGWCRGPGWVFYWPWEAWPNV